MGHCYHTEKKYSFRLDQAGFTLIEMVVVTAVFVIVMIVASEAFLRIMTRSNILSQREESNIEGVIALEMFRKDLVQAGFGLPLDFDGTPPAYSEAAAAPAADYNDSGTAKAIPRPFVAGNDLVIVGGPLAKTDYLALKGTPLSLNEAARKWTYVNYSSSGKTPKAWSDDSLQDGDRVVVLKRTFSETAYTSKLMHDASTFYTSYNSDKLDEKFRPQVQGQTCYVYGISSDQDPRMPFNRSDYYIRRPADIPASCADNTGVLYKAVVKNNKEADGGTLTEIPIMDCVANMQVVFGWDIKNGGVIDTYSNADGTEVSGTGTEDDVKAAMKDAEPLRKKLKLVKVYLLVQDGGRDPSFRNQQEIIVGNKDNGEGSLTKTYTVADLDAMKWTNYRWKVYRIVITPKNL